MSASTGSSASAPQTAPTETASVGRLVGHGAMGGTSRSGIGRPAPRARRHRRHKQSSIGRLVGLRAVIAHGDFDSYWHYHLDREHQRIHASRYKDPFTFAA